MSPLRVAIDARLEDGAHGGVQQYILGLVHGLGRLEDGDEQYILLTYEGQDDWLRPHLTNRFILMPERLKPESSVTRVRRRAAAAMPYVRKLWRTLPNMGSPVPIPRSDGRVEAAGASVLHFPKQSFFKTDLACIFQPHDLQHVHLPEFFSPRERALRENFYRAACEYSTMVVTSSSWVRDDVIRQYGLVPEKVTVIPPAPVLGAYPVPTEYEVAAVKEKLGLPERFLLYPAQTWPHKNHIALVKALALLQDRTREKIHLVLSGKRNAHASLIDREIRELNLQTQVHFTGFVSPLELQVLYRLATGVVIPTRFEAASFPMWEAFLSKVPVATSNVTSLPAQAGDAALIFDPDDIEDIAESMYALWTDQDLREQLIGKGLSSVVRFTWEGTARAFRAHYRRLAGVQLTDEDIQLIQSKPML